MKTSKPVRGSEAEKLGLVDACVPRSEVVEKACEIALEMANGNIERRRSLFLYDKLEPIEV